MKCSVAYLTPEQQARRDRSDAALGCEASRLDELRARAARPDGVGEGISPCAPARGPAKLFRPEEVVKTEAGAMRFRRMTEAGAHALRMADAFDVMEEQAARRAKSRNRDAEPLFTAAQVEAGRAFAEVYEFVAKGGVKCASLEGRTGGGGHREFMDIYAAACERHRRMVAAIGTGWAIEPKRAAPHGDRRRAIRSLTLVHMVCVQQLGLTDVLARFGWSRSQKVRDGLRAALADSLDAIYGL